MMKHGANIYKYANKLKCKADEIIDFSSNINLYTKKINLTLTDNMVVKYANTSYPHLRSTITQKYKIKKNQIALYNGATTAIHSLFQSLDAKRIYLYAPLYGEYEKALSKRAKVIKINRSKNLYKKPKKGSVVVFVNPSTPDAIYYDLSKLFALWKRQKCTIILDESFLEFQNLHSLRNQIDNYKKLYIIQSFSKFYACAGVRIGAIFSQKRNIEQLKIPIWNISSFDSEFLTLRLMDKKFGRKSKKLHKKQKKELFDILKNSKLFDKIYKSDTNFILVKSKKSKEIFKHLLRHKILIRPCESFDFLTSEHLRFAVKTTNAHNKLTEAFKSF
ncbi:aminotransferase class I/II-fold pyridoxal phosphate-dependent enzyme [Sulfurimonas sp.]|uniref:aminotransferase class I/II-fold pyridoxal phosphate-dependent enzyme n=1 Tax=Sulfurimonas sp. TaxID=2022749 RepID=UPI002AB0A643|nr:aminotransferase class I/II-fold pyridoxal phosphate-dependent enzyme [Sulfurimonas sp.]